MVTRVFDTFIIFILFLLTTWMKKHISVSNCYFPRLIWAAFDPRLSVFLFVTKEIVIKERKCVEFCAKHLSEDLIDRVDNRCRYETDWTGFSDVGILKKPSVHITVELILEDLYFRQAEECSLRRFRDNNLNRKICETNKLTDCL